MSSASHGEHMAFPAMSLAQRQLLVWQHEARTFPSAWRVWSPCRIRYCGNSALGLGSLWQTWHIISAYRILLCAHVKHGDERGAAYRCQVDESGKTLPDVHLLGDPLYTMCADASVACQCITPVPPYRCFSSCEVRLFDRSHN